MSSQYSITEALDRFSTGQDREQGHWAGRIQPEISLAAQVVVNGRFRVHKTTGIGRYANEIISRLGTRLQVLEPSSRLRGIKGHLWEQFALPLHAANRLVWSPCSTGPALLARQVVTIHDLFPIENPEWFSRTFASGFRSVVVPLLRRARRIISVSEFTKRSAVRLTGIDERKVTVIHSGVGPQFAPQSLDSIRRAQAATGLLGKRYLLAVSSLEPRKNVARILEAWRRALPELPSDLWLVMVGAKGSSTVFQSLSISEPPGRVIMPGYVQDRDLVGLYAGARALVYPSLAEGFGLPVLEAMACGLPVLTSDNSSLTEVAGDAALFADPTDVDAIARCIRALATDDHLCLRLSQMGLERASRFSWATAADKTWQVLESELPKERSR